MTAPAEILEGSQQDVLLLCDHASNAVPPGIALGIAPELLDLHIGVDIGAGPLTRSLSAALDVPAILATVSRLVIDLHREPDHISLIPHVSDGHPIPGNEQADRGDRIARFHAPYHRLLAARVRAQRPRLILSIHSFTPRLEHGGSDRPWEAGILYNRDARAALPAIRWLEAQGCVTGDNEPYSGRLLNATLNRHAEANGIASIAIEIRNDLIDDDAGLARWTVLLAGLANSLRNSLACGSSPAQ
ncbi:N-formylglutamate amidohydrolase [Sphingomonas xinjiangensis]|uniref:Putative N-formylglutamate amidohydrolase n=1 Tax=Sphingomonas xinjiangensis TaxID=643568 RepID=A0A840YKC0_9SPHN|nr:N-formylglutamate amidohydrolase [Sphingomonas xinjiangensis]MBB5709410.1 putative N-formylglutamate amidohydrolase [Sphingomonas xinjiangensis]